MSVTLKKRPTVQELLNQMMDADMDLYERILDTMGFAYAFNELVKLAIEARGE